MNSIWFICYPAKIKVIHHGRDKETHKMNGTFHCRPLLNHTNPYTYIHAQVHIYTCKMHTHACTHTCTHTYKHTHIHRHTCTYMCMYAHIHRKFIGIVLDSYESVLSILYYVHHTTVSIVSLGVDICVYTVSDCHICMGIANNLILEGGN